MKRERRLAGYRLHRARLDRAQDGSHRQKAIRTHKYPLALAPGPAAALHGETSRIAPALNGSGPDTLIHFVVVALSQGGVIARSSGDLRDFVAAHGGGTTGAPWMDRVIATISGRWKKVFASLGLEARLTLEALLTRQRRKVAGQTPGEVPTGLLQEWANVWGLEIEKREIKDPPEHVVSFLRALKEKLRSGPCTGQMVRESFDAAFGASAASTEKAVAEGSQTLALLPAADVVAPDIRSVLLDHLQPLASRAGKKVEDLNGTATNQTGLSSLLGAGLAAFRAGEKEGWNYLAPVCTPLWEGREAELRRRIREICAAARAVPIDPGPWAASWADYRELAGGRLQGWTSNFLRRLGELREGIGKHVQIWARLRDGIDWASPVVAPHLELRDRIEILGGLAGEMSDALASGLSSAKDLSELDFYVSEAAAVREILERWSREGFDPEACPLEQKLVTKKPPQGVEAWTKGRVRFDEKHLPRTLPRYPREIGEARDLMEERLMDAGARAVQLLVEACAFVSGLEGTFGAGPEDGWDEDAYRGSLDSVYRVALRARKESELRALAMDFVSSRTSARRKDLEEKELRFFVSPYARQRRTPLRLVGGVPAFEEFRSALRSELRIAEPRSEQEAAAFLGFGGEALVDGLEKIELLKIWWSLSLRTLPASGLQIESPPLLAQLPVARFLRAGTRAGLQRVIQAGYGSELRGALSLVNRTSYIERAVIQISNGEQTRLAYLPREGKVGWRPTKGVARRLEKAGISSDAGPTGIARAIVETADAKQRLALLPLLAQLPHGWGAVLKESKRPDKATQCLDALADYRTEEVIAFEKSKDGDRFRPRIEKGRIVLPVRTSRYQTQFMTRFLQSATSRDRVFGLAGAALITEANVESTWSIQDGSPRIERRSGDHRSYMAIPWETSRQMKPAVKSEPRNLIGIDLGEYGFGWAVIDPKGKLLDSGFCSEPRLVALRSAVDRWQDRQARGVFVRPETRLQRMREAASGRIRNEIHRLALEHGARPVYEHEVSRFEVGSARLRRLYKTLKKTDVPESGNDADKAAARHTWGSRMPQGSSIGAAYTSQTCRSCGRCAAGAARKGGDNRYSIERGFVTIGVGTSHEGRVSVESEEATIAERDLLRQIREGMRSGGEDPARGTQDRFHCPYDDCRAEADADEQAAQNIALKRLWFDALTERKKKEANSLDVFFERSPAHARRTG